MASTNFHTHSSYCDGEGKLEDYIIEAVKKGFITIGFTSHAPLPFTESFVMKETDIENYLDEIKTLQKKYFNVIQIYRGLEIDYIPGVIGPGSVQIQELKLDYTIGSVHMIMDSQAGRAYCIDENREGFESVLNNLFQGDIQKFVTRYYELVREMIVKHEPTIIGHLDLIKKFNSNNRFFDEESNWYKDAVLQTLETIAESDCLLEVNTGGMARGFTHQFYPSSWIMKECQKLGIPIILNSDAHIPLNLDAYFEESIKILREIGYRTQHILFNGIWQEAVL